jgi:subtilisin family serine protease
MIRNIAFRHHDILEDSIESVDGLAVLRDEDGLTAEEVAEEYNSIKGLVEYAEPNYEITLDRDPSTGTRRVHPNDERFSDQWSLSNSGQNGGTNNADISALLAWAKSKGSEDVVVAVLDSGVDYRHPDLIGNMWHRPDSVASYSDSDLGEIEDFRGFNAVYKDGDPMDDNGHGTHCAGIIGAEGGNEIGITGINWHVQIMPLKFMDANGSGTTKAAIEAINYVIDRKQAGVNVRIISASWGSTIKSKALEDAIRKAGEEGILFVAAAGNSSEDSDKRPHFPAGYDLPNMISVAATDREDNLAPFSNWGLKSVHIAAPGKEILSTWLNGEFREASGTSMATPEVAGVAALVLSSESDLSVKQLRERLFTSVDKLPSLKGKVASGGRLNAARALGAE